MDSLERRVGELEEESRRTKLVLTGDLKTVGLIESVRNLTALVGEMKQKQDAIATDIAAIRAAEQQRMDIRLGEQRAAKRLRTFFYIVGTLILAGGGSVFAYLGRFLVTIGVPPS